MTETDEQGSEEILSVLDVTRWPGGIDRIPWPSELAQNLPRNEPTPPPPLSAAPDRRQPWPSEIAQTLQPRREHQPPTPAPVAPFRNEQPPPLALQPRDIHDWQERGLDLAPAVSPEQANPAATTHSEATTTTAPYFRSLRPLLPKPPDDESDEASRGTVAPGNSGSARLGCRGGKGRKKKKCSGERGA